MIRRPQLWVGDQEVYIYYGQYEQREMDIGHPYVYTLYERGKPYKSSISQYIKNVYIIPC